MSETAENSGGQGEPKAPPADVQIYRPAHGGWLKPVQPGEVRNPLGISSRYVEVRRLAAAASPDAMRALIVIAHDLSEDSRARIVAIQSILERGVGKPRDHSAEDAKERPDLSRLSREDRELLASIMLRALGKAP